MCIVLRGGFLGAWRDARFQQLISAEGGNATGLDFIGKWYFDEIGVFPHKKTPPQNREFLCKIPYLDVYRLELFLQIKLVFI